MRGKGVGEPLGTPEEERGEVKKEKKGGTSLSERERTTDPGNPWNQEKEKEAPKGPGRVSRRSLWQGQGYELVVQGQTRRGVRRRRDEQKEPRAAEKGGKNRSRVGVGGRARSGRGSIATRSLRGVRR